MSGRDDRDDGGRDGDDAEPASDPDPFVFDADPDPEPDPDATDSPLGDLARDVERRRRERTERTGRGEGSESDADVDELFDDRGVETDEEDVWASLAAAEADADDASTATTAASTGPSSPADGRAAPGIDDDVDRVPREDADADRPDHVVPKRSYCQRCPYFSGPPQVRCSHDGTEIVDLPDFEHFRVRGCPMVERGGPAGHVE